MEVSHYEAEYPGGQGGTSVSQELEWAGAAPLGHNSTPGGPGDAARARLPWTTNTNTAFPCTPGAGSLCPLPGEPPWARRPAVPPSPRGIAAMGATGPGRGGEGRAGPRGAGIQGSQCSRYLGEGWYGKKVRVPSRPGAPPARLPGQLPSRAHPPGGQGPPPLGAGQEGARE